MSNKECGSSGNSSKRKSRRKRIEEKSSDSAYRNSNENDDQKSVDYASEIATSDTNQTDFVATDSVDTSSSPIHTDQLLGATVVTTVITNDPGSDLRGETQFRTVIKESTTESIYENAPITLVNPESINDFEEVLEEVVLLDNTASGKLEATATGNLHFGPRNFEGASNLTPTSSYNSACDGFYPVKQLHVDIDTSTIIGVTSKDRGPPKTLLQERILNKVEVSPNPAKGSANNPAKGSVNPKSTLDRGPVVYGGTLENPVVYGGTPADSPLSIDEYAQLRSGSLNQFGFYNTDVSSVGVNHHNDFAGASSSSAVPRTDSPGKTDSPGGTNSAKRTDSFGSDEKLAYHRLNRLEFLETLSERERLNKVERASLREQIDFTEARSSGLGGTDLGSVGREVAAWFRTMAGDQIIDNAIVASQSLDLVVNRIRKIISESSSIRAALYYRLLRITQYLAWKFPSYGGLQRLLEDVIRCKSRIGKQTTTVYLLGQQYESNKDPLFQANWNAKFLFTYRKNFKPILNTAGAQITSDSGWGCYIRVFQMLLAQCYSTVIFGKDWKPELRDQPVEREFVKELFVDNESSLFSVQNFCRVGLQHFRREPGTWFGPYSAAKTVEVIFDEFLDPKQPGKHYANVLQTCVFDELFDPDLVVSKLKERPNSGVVCLLCKKLGVDASISPAHTEAVKQVFKLASFQGLASGDTGRSAHYFIAGDESQAYYLDPHIEVRPALDGAEMDTSSWHPLQNNGQPCLLQLPFENLNSSCCFVFLVRSTEDLSNLILSLEMYDGLSEIFEVARGDFRNSTMASINDYKIDADIGDEELVLL